MNEDKIQSKIDLALFKNRSELNSRFLLEKQSLKNENDKLKRDIAELRARSTQGSVQAQGRSGRF